MKKLSIIVTGANGQLGKCLRDIAPNYPNIDFHFFGRDELPVNDFGLVTKTILAINPTALINAAAYTAVDKAESETALAFLMNGEAVANLASVCKNGGIKFLHVSTDYVFNGEASVPYLETDRVDPVNAYGASKLRGEELALAQNPSAFIIRTSWVYSRHGNNFVKTMLRLMQERPTISVVNDQLGCPTYAIDLAEALIRVAQSENAGGGIYHFSNSGPISWYDFALAIKNLSGRDCIVNPIETSAFPTPAKRPRFSVMNNNKINTAFGIEQKEWVARLQECLSGMVQV